MDQAAADGALSYPLTNLSLSHERGPRWGRALSSHPFPAGPEQPWGNQRSMSTTVRAVSIGCLLTFAICLLPLQPDLVQMT